MKKNVSVIRTSVILLIALVMLFSIVCIPSRAAEAQGGTWKTKTRTFANKKVLKRFLDKQIYNTDEKTAIQVFCKVAPSSRSPQLSLVTIPTDGVVTLSKKVAKKEKNKLLKWYSRGKKAGSKGMQIKYKVWKPGKGGPYYSNRIIWAKNRFPNVPD